METSTIATPAFWVIFSLVITAVLALDLGVFHRKSHELKFREALGWSIVWTSLALLFGIMVYFRAGTDKALEFVTGYLIEWALSVDNIFIFIVIFSYFAVPKALQHRVLFWGILGAIVMRATFIFVGTALLNRFHWIIYVFGGVLIVTAVRLFFQKEADIHPERNPALRLFKRFVPTISEYRGDHFFVKEGGKRYATPLCLVLIMIEFTDLVFAVDSIPAIFAITRDPFIVFTSNIFAILGLRSLYFLLYGIIDKFHFLKTGLAIVLAFVGTKMLISDVYKIPTLVSLTTVAGTIFASMILSLIFPKKKQADAK